MICMHRDGKTGIGTNRHRDKGNRDRDLGNRESRGNTVANGRALGKNSFSESTFV